MLTKLSVKKPYSVIVAVVIIVLLGIAAFTGIRTDLLPDVDYPYALIVTEYKDASPEEVEKTVTQPIEKSLATIGKVVSVDSVSTAGRSVVTVEFDPSVNMDSVVAELREAFEPLRAEWGSSISSPLIRKINPDTMPVIVASIDVEGQDAYEISMFTEETLMGHLEGIDGVADLTVEGLVSEHVQITIDPEKLAAVNAEIFAAIGGDYEKARAALEAADAELGSASSQMSSELLNETASIDAQLRTLNDQLAKAKGNEAYSNSNIEDIKKRIKALEEEYIVYAEDPDLTEEEEERKAELEQELAAERAALAAAEEDLGGDNEEIASLEKQIAALEARRADLVAQMTTAESELAKSRADITDQLNELATAEEAAKAEADLENLITPEMVGTMLDAQNFSSTAGSLALGNKEYDVKVGDEITSLDELNQLVLFHFDLEGVDDVLLSDVANVEVVNNSNEIYSRINGHDGVVISFFKQSDHSTAETAANIWEVFDTIEERYPSVTITVLSDQSVYIDNVSGAVAQNLILGAILAVLVLMLFLRDFRPTLVVAASIPVSLMFAVALMYFTGVTMNIFSLAGLALGVGMLVDNSIVVMENIYRCRTVGLPRRDAAVKGAKQVTAALISSTLTTICVFVPVLFTDGLSRQLFSDIGLTIAYALLASLIIAFTLVPAMAAGVLRNMDHKESVFGTFVKEKYRAILRWVLCHRVFILCFAVLMLVFCGYFSIARGTSFLPESESSEMTLTVTMEENASTEVLWETTDQIVDILLNMDDVKSVGAVADSGGMITSGGVSEGNATVIYVVLEDRKKNSCAAIEDMVLLQAAELGCDIDVSVGSYDLSSLYEDGVSITVSGRDLDVLASITADMGDLLLSVEGLENVKSSVDTATPTLKVSVNKTEAMKYGLTVSEVYDFIARSIRNSANATTLSDMDTDVIVIDGGASDLELVDIQNLKMPVENEDGTVTSVSIASIATISEEAGAPVIYRDDQVRYMTATADVTEGYNVGLVSEEVDELIAGYVPPEGYRISLSGEEAVIDSSLSDLLFLLALAFLLIYLILVAQFQSLLTPLIIMLSVPLSFTGGFLALLISGRDISIIAMVGFLLLSGIVVNNGIVLVDYINRLRRSGRVMSEAVIEGACIRLRPILMTATTTILAIMTLAFGMGVGAEVVQPMAIVVFGGMIFAVFVTLFVIPGVYDLVLRRKEDTAEELARGYHLNDPEEDESVTMEKRDSAKQAEESPEDNAEDEEDTEEEKPKKTGFFARLKAKFNDDDEEEEEEESAEDEEDDEEEDLDKKPRFRFFRRHDEEYEEDDEDDEEDEEEDDEDEEKSRFRFFRRRTVEEDEDEDEEEDEDDDDEDEEVTPRRRFGFSLFRRKNREEDEDDEDEDDDDEDYYGIRERHPRS